MDKRCVLLTGILVVAASLSLAAPAKKAQPASKYSVVPFTGSVTPGFIGNDAQAIYRVLTRSITTKSEFESTAQYEQKRLEAESKPLYGNLRRDSLLSFVLECSQAQILQAQFSAKYDADERLLHVKFRDDNGHSQVYVGFNERSSLSSVSWRKKSRSERRYAATNAFGATVDVDEYVDDELAIAYDPRNTKSFYDFPISLPPERAKSVKPRVRVLVIGKLRTPRTYEGTHYIEPTVMLPTSIIVNHMYLNLAISDVWVFDSGTGEILAKASAK